MKLPIREGNVRAVGALLAVVVLAMGLVACSTGRPELSFEPDRLPAAASGQPYQAIITVTGNQTPVGDIYVSDGSLPDGMTLDFTRGSSTNATLSGTPAAAGSYVFTVSAWCLGTNVSGQEGDASYSLVVN